MSTIRAYILGAIGIVILGMGIAIYVLNWRLENAQETLAARDKEIEGLRREAAVQQTLTEIRADIVKTVQQATVDAEERARRTAEQISEIDRAPESDDGPVAPVLDRTIEQLRRGRTP